MKDAKFMELLNLYVDQQIDPADAALLEEEILRNPARQRTYQQYCRMHRACEVVFEQSRTAEGREKYAAVASSESRIHERPFRRSWNPLVLVSGFAAAAACVAVIGYLRVSSPDANQPTIANVPQAPVAQHAVAVAPPAPAAAGVGEFQVILNGDANGARLLAGGSPLNANLVWLMEAKVTPLIPSPAPSIVFETNADPKAGTLLPPASLAPRETATESVGFQFQK